MKDMLRTLVSQAKADYLEIRIEETDVSSLRFQGPTLEAVNANKRFGGCVRALVKGGGGFVTFNDLDNLQAKIDLAIHQARLVGAAGGDAILAPVPVVEDVVEVPFKEDPRTVSLAGKIELFKGYNEIILSHGKPVVSSSINYFDQYSKIHFANSEGPYILQHKLDLAGSITAIASDGGTTRWAGPAWQFHRLRVARNLDAKVKEACTKAVNLLAAPPVRGGDTVIVDPDLAGIFALRPSATQRERLVYENPNCIRPCSWAPNLVRSSSTYTIAAWTSAPGLSEI